MLYTDDQVILMMDSRRLRLETELDLLIRILFFSQL